MRDDYKLQTGAMIAIIGSVLIICFAGCILMHRFDFSIGFRQQNFCILGLILMVWTTIAGHRLFLKYGYYIVAVACFMAIMHYIQIWKFGIINKFLLLQVYDTELLIDVPVLMNIAMGLGVVKFCSEHKPAALFEKFSPKIIYGIGILILLPLTFILSIQKGFFISITTAVLAVLFVKKIFRSSYMLGILAIAVGTLGYILSYRIRPSYEVEQKYQMIMEGRWNGIGGGDEQLLFNSGINTDFVYALNTCLHGWISTLSILLLFAIFFFISIGAALRIRSESGKLLVIYSATILVAQSIFSFLTVFQITKILFFTNVPFFGYGEFNVAGSLVLVGLICSAIIEDLKSGNDELTDVQSAGRQQASEAVSGSESN